jgi:hypothetical protein
MAGPANTPRAAPVDVRSTDDGARLRLPATGGGSHTISTGAAGRSTDPADTSGGRRAHRPDTTGGFREHLRAKHQPNAAGFTNLAAAQRRTSVANPRTTASVEPISPGAPSTGCGAAGKSGTQPQSRGCGTFSSLVCSDQPARGGEDRNASAYDDGHPSRLGSRRHQPCAHRPTRRQRPGCGRAVCAPTQGWRGSDERHRLAPAGSRHESGPTRQLSGLNRDSRRE